MFQNNFSTFIGIDVAKDKIDFFFFPSGKYTSCPNNKSQIKKLLKGIDSKKTLAIIENTGGYENVCLDTLLMLKINTHRTDNRKVKAFIRSFGIYAKTDKIDAKALALYGNERHLTLTLYQKPSADQEKLRATASYLAEIKRLRAAEKNKLKNPNCDSVKNSIKHMITLFDKVVLSLETDLEQIALRIPNMNKNIELLTEFKGIGRTSAIQLIAHLPELGSLSRREIAALAGLAPYAKDSGKKQGLRRVYGGREIVRRTLFMAALSATKCNPEIKEFYERLKSSGKKPMVALTASMRKMITILNAIIRDQKLILT